MGLPVDDFGAGVEILLGMVMRRAAWWANPVAGDVAATVRSRDEDDALHEQRRLQEDEPAQQARAVFARSIFISSILVLKPQSLSPASTAVSR